MFIDTHVHLRDFNQAHKETIRHGLEVARDSGVDAVFDMPNTDPPIMAREMVEVRLHKAKEANVPEVFYGLYLGATKNPEQLKQAVKTYREFFPHVVGIKLYAGHSVGNLGVISKQDQRIVYTTLAQEGYEGILAVHCEKESEMNHSPFDPLQAITHCYARPEAAEVASLEDQLHLVKETGFRGKLHIAHISSPKAVKLVYQAKQEGINISSAICPHHFIYDWQQMNNEQGLLWKMNPPLRSPESRSQILNDLRDGKIDWIETDHAPHNLKEKADNPYMSGIPGLAWWPLFEEFLRQHNFTDNQIEQLTFTNIQSRYGIDISRKNRPLKDHRQDYPFDPYHKIAEELKW